MSSILDGKKLGDRIADDLKSAISDLMAEGLPQPHLAIIQVGNKPESTIYIGRKKKFGERIGVGVTHVHLPEDISQEEMLGRIRVLNGDEHVHGIIVQLPLPAHLDRAALLNAILPEKDVDGLGEVNAAKLLNAEPDAIVPATTRGIITLLKENNIHIEGKHAVVVGRSALVGKPTATALANSGARVTVCHSGTADLAAETKLADILVVAVGRPRLITAEHVSPGQAVIDVGINPDPFAERKIVGDVDFAPVSEIVGSISPVPGGVGPMTVTSLFQNVVDAYIKKARFG